MNSRRLAAVLRVRELQERGARGELARRNEQLRRAAGAEARTWAALDRATDPGMSSQQLDAQHVVRCAGLLAATSQRLITERAEEDADTARDAWTIAARRVEALERLRDRTSEAESLELERLQNNELDDLVLARRNTAEGRT